MLWIKFRQNNIKERQLTLIKMSLAHEYQIMYCHTQNIATWQQVLGVCHVNWWTKLVTKSTEYVKMKIRIWHNLAFDPITTKMHWRQRKGSLLCDSIGTALAAQTSCTAPTVGTEKHNLEPRTCWRLKAVETPQQCTRSRNSLEPVRYRPRSIDCSSPHADMSHLGNVNEILDVPLIRND